MMSTRELLELIANSHVCGLSGPLPYSMRRAFTAREVAAGMREARLNRSELSIFTQNAVELTLENCNPDVCYYTSDNSTVALHESNAATLADSPFGQYMMDGVIDITDLDQWEDDEREALVSVIEQLEDYPILDEELFSEYEHARKENDWEDFGEHDMADNVASVIPECWCAEDCGYTGTNCPSVHDWALLLVGRCYSRHVDLFMYQVFCSDSELDISATRDDVEQWAAAANLQMGKQNA